MLLFFVGISSNFLIGDCGAHRLNAHKKYCILFAVERGSQIMSVECGNMKIEK